MYQSVMPVLREQDKTRKNKIEKTIERLEALKTKRPVVAKIFKEVQGLVKAIRKFNRATIMFQSNAIVSLVSRYDAFTGDIIRTVLLAHPDRLNKPDKTLSLEEALELKTVERIVERFIDKEVETVLRDSHSDHFKYLEGQLKIPLRKNLPIWPSLIELTERRNLFAHCGGTVSTQYLRVCKLNKVQLDSKIAEGQVLIVDEKYFENAFKILYEIGLKLGQTTYRKLFSDQLQHADTSLIRIGYDLLLSEQWELAKIVFDYAVNLESKWISDDQYHKMFIINKCIALKYSGATAEFKTLLSSVDWSSSNSRFLLAVAVLNEDYERANKIMLTMNGKEPIDEAGFREWPLFRDFRKTDYFKKAFKKIYRKDFDETEFKEELLKAKEITAIGPATNV